MLFSWFANVGSSHSQSVFIESSSSRRYYRQTVTRIVSGCANEAEKQRASRTSLADAVMGEMVHLYFTPDFTPKAAKSGRGQFIYMNKPFGVHSWLSHGAISQWCTSLVDTLDAESIPKAMAVPLPPTFSEEEERLLSGNGTGLLRGRQLATRLMDDCTVVLLDPDMIVLNGFDHYADMVHEMDSESDQSVVIGAAYAIGDRWVDWHLCDAADCLLKRGKRPLIEHYAVGPPLIMTFSLWRAVAPLWTAYSPPILEAYER